MKNKIKLSHTTIVKNEERVIGRCIDSIKDIVDESIIVDTGSVDNTIKIIKNKIKKCYYYKWAGDYSAARNYGVKQCTGDWILVQDADEHMSPKSVKLIKEILEKTPDNIWEILVRVHDYTDATLIPQYIVYGHRLFRNHKDIKWGGKGHEALTTPLIHRTQDPRLVILHDKTPSAVSPIKPGSTDLAQVFVSNFLDSIDKNPKDARSMFYLANTLMGQLKYQEAIKWYHIYLKTSNWNDERYQARLFCARCYIFLKKIKNAREMMLDAYEERMDRNEGDILLGDIAFNEKKYEQALIWFHLAEKKLEKAQQGIYPETLLFLEGKAYTYLPYDWLAITYYHLGNYYKAKEYTIKVLKFLPNNKRLQGNLLFYKNK